MYATVRSYGPSDLVAQLRQHQDAVKSLMGTVVGLPGLLHRGDE